MFFSPTYKTGRSLMGIRLHPAAETVTTVPA